MNEKKIIRNILWDLERVFYERTLFSDSVVKFLR